MIIITRKIGITERKQTKTHFVDANKQIFFILSFVRAFVVVCLRHFNKKKGSNGKLIFLPRMGNWMDVK